jgi:PAS domain S-box-containing protein
MEVPMGPYVALNAVLVGSFGFAAIYHLVLWSQSRRNALLLIFSVHCALCSILSASLLALVTAHTVQEAQRALNLRLDVAALGQVSAVWILSLISGVRARPFVWFITVVFLAATVVNVAILPLTGTVTAVERISTSWGEPISILHRQAHSRWLGPLYALVLTVYLFGLVCAARLWTADRVGGLLIAAGSAAGVVILLWSELIDTSGSRQPYPGALFYLLWVLLFPIQIAREHRLRADRLDASERRFRGIFDHTFEFIGLLSPDGTLLEANQTALNAAGIRAADVVGKPFWDTRWWSHAPDLQERLRQAVRASAAGDIVRFEATHPSADGRLRAVDFSLKPVRDDHGEVVLLIPEGRDVTDRKQAQHALEESREQLRCLADGLLLAREEERTVIAREIHDVLGQALTALKMDTAWIGRRLSDGATAMHDKLAAMAALIDETVVTVRRIATELRPGILDDLGLAAAVEWQAQQFEQRTSIHCESRADVDEADLDPLVSTAMFRILQESLTNVARHSRASHATVTLEQSGANLVLEVRDDGIGILAANESSARSIGLAGMRERAQLVGGTCSISGAAGAGTTVRVQIPQRERIGV